MESMQNNYYAYDRQEFSQLFRSNHKVQNIEKLYDLVSINDRLSKGDIAEIYKPLIQYIDIFYQQSRSLAREKGEFLKLPPNKHKPPFIIGISGSVAVGKSTVARVLQELLKQAYGEEKVDLITTDGFLYSTQELKDRNLMHRKGFPESYDMESLVRFMSEVKQAEPNIEYPLYSHDEYDVIPDQVGIIDRPSILIVEGINTLQLPDNQRIYVSDFFDLSIYIDADTMNIRRWFIERFMMLMDIAKDDPSNYFYDIAQKSPEEIEITGNETWYTINLTNLIENIAPTRSRADVVLYKGENHAFKQIYLRKY